MLTRALSDIDAEVRYAVRHEYAQTAVDVLARRTRLSFLNVRAALDALPRVVDIMAEEYNWSRSERKRQVERAVKFFESMGLSPGSVPILPETTPRGLLERTEDAVWRFGSALLGTLGYQTQASRKQVHSRSKFEHGEVAALKNAFTKSVGATGGDSPRVMKKEVMDILKEVPGYEGISRKDYDYVFEEAGLQNQEFVDFDEFVEVSISHQSFLNRPLTL